MTTSGTTPSGTTPAAEPRIQVKIPADLRDWLNRRAQLMLFAGRSFGDASYNQQARSDLLLLRDLLAAELERIPLTLWEAQAIADVAKGSLLQPYIGAGIGLAYASCEEDFRYAREEGPVPGYSSYGRKWGIDEEVLLAKLRALGPAADAALRAAIAAWWDRDETSEDTDEQAFRSLGLRLAADVRDCRYCGQRILRVDRDDTIPESLTERDPQWRLADPAAADEHGRRPSAEGYDQTFPWRCPEREKADAGARWEHRPPPTSTDVPGLDDLTSIPSEVQNEAPSSSARRSRCRSHQADAATANNASVGHRHRQDADVSGSRSLPRP
jgi:hypothetical protein